MNDKANVVEFHGRRLKSLGTRFENTYVIACSYIDISCVRMLTWVEEEEEKKWDKCKSEKHYVPGVLYSGCVQEIIDKIGQDDRCI